MKPDPRAIIALDLGGTKLAAAMFSQDGRPRLQRVVQLNDREGMAVGKLVVAEVRRLHAVIQRRGLALRAVGISVPGIANARTGRVWAPNLPGWEDFPLQAMLRDALADPAVKVVIDSDRTASILGEAWRGAAQGCRDAIFVAVGTGIGAGILANGKVLRGAHGIAGAIGWLALDRPYRAEYAACGCFESYASGDGLATRFKAASTQRIRRQQTSQASEAFTARDLFAAVKSNDPVANEVLAQAVQFWGMASANLVSIFNPAMIIFGGGVFGPATRLLDDIATEARRWAQPISIRQVRFETSRLGPLAALYGAGYLALRRAGFSRAQLTTLAALK